jgi:hypothetical protein
VVIAELAHYLSQIAGDYDRAALVLSLIDEKVTKEMSEMYSYFEKKVQEA